MVRVEFAPLPEWFLFESDDHEEYHLNPDTGEYISSLTNHPLAQAIVDQIKEQYKPYVIGDYVYEDNDGYITKKLNRVTTHIGLYHQAKHLIEETIPTGGQPVEFASRLIQLQREPIKLHGRFFCVVALVKEDHIALIVSDHEIYVHELFTVCRLYDDEA